MSLAFLSSSLEPGADGVGDYVRLLSRECALRGRPSIGLALHDRHVSGVRVEDQDGWPVVRLGRNLPWKQKLEFCTAVLGKNKITDLSLQYVGYGFNPRGLTPGLGRHLRPLGRGRRFHLMFHELWLGSQAGASLKERCLGWVQRQCALDLVRTLQPQMIHTSNTTYRALLLRHRVQASLLPLFGNVPLLPRPQSGWLCRVLQEHGIPIDPQQRKQTWVFGFFGTLHPIWPPQPLLGLIEAAARRWGKKVVFCSIGRMGSGGALWEGLSRDYGSKFSFCQLGPQPGPLISTWLQQIDFGIATSPWSLLGKSGTAIAMLEHGLPVLVNRNDVRYAGIPEETLPPFAPLILRMDDDSLPERLGNLQRGPAHLLLPEVTRRFLADLSGVAP